MTLLGARLMPGPAVDRTMKADDFEKAITILFLLKTGRSSSASKQIKCSKVVMQYSHSRLCRSHELRLLWKFVLTILNVDLYDDQWLQTSLSVTEGDKYRNFAIIRIHWHSWWRFCLPPLRSQITSKWRTTYKLFEISITDRTLPSVTASVKYEDVCEQLLNTGYIVQLRALSRIQYVVKSIHRDRMSHAQCIGYVYDITNC